MNILNYIISRLKERSTWLGLVSLTTAIGVSLSPEQTEAIVQAGISLAALVAIFTKDEKDDAS